MKSAAAAAAAAVATLTVWLTTPALFHGWAVEHDEPAERVADALHRIERRARFVPPRSDPRRDWWSEIGR